jgi:hypothetical protein
MQPRPVRSEALLAIQQRIEAEFAKARVPRTPIAAPAPGRTTLETFNVVGWMPHNGHSQQISPNPIEQSAFVVKFREIWVPGPTLPISLFLRTLHRCWTGPRVELNYHAEQTATVQLRSHVSDYGHSIWNHLGGDGMGSAVAGLSLELRL